MGRSTSRLIALMACLCLGMPGLAQEEFALKVGLESAEFPDLDATPVIEADPGTVFEITGNMMVGSSAIEGDVGPQGWSWGVANTTEGLTILSTTIEGTVSEAAPAGLVDFGFVVNDLIEPGNNGGKEGSVQAVVLSFTQPVTLPPNTDQITAKNTYQVTVGDAEIVATIGFEEGLVGQGQPVANNVTYENQTRTPTLGEKQITITPPVVIVDEVGPVLCDNGIDDDNDGLIDCDDPDCAPDS